MQVIKRKLPRYSTRGAQAGTGEIGSEQAPTCFVSRRGGGLCMPPGRRDLISCDRASIIQMRSSVLLRNHGPRLPQVPGAALTVIHSSTSLSLSVFPFIVDVQVRVGR